MKQGFTYLIQQDEYLKIGFTNNLFNRIRQYETHNVNPNLIYYIIGNVEKELHQLFYEYKYKNEWFYYNDNIIKYFNENGIKCLDENYFEIYINIFASACDNLTGNAIKFFSKCLKHSLKDQGEGNYFMINDPYLQQEFISAGLKSNVSKYLKELIDNEFIYKIRRCQYGINPMIAYCGDKHKRAKLYLKLIKE